MRVDSVLLVALALLAGSLAAVASDAVGVAAIGLVAVLARRTSLIALLVALAAMGLSAWRGSRALGEFEVHRIAARDALGAPARCAASATIVESPTWRGDAISYLADLDGLDCDGRRIAARLRARLYGGPANLGRGDRLHVVAQLAPVRLFRNPGVLDPTPFSARKGAVYSGLALAVEVEARGSGLAAAVDRARAFVRRRIAATFAPNAVPMARALVLGESDLPAEDDEAFRKSGLSHLLAVSGTHLVFAVVALVRALAFVLVRIERIAARRDVGRIAAALGIPLALGYADFAGGSGSAWRAAWMLAVAFAVRAAGRHPSGVRAFALSCVIGAIVDPLAAFDISFLLSAAATAGLLVFNRPLSALLEIGKERRGWGFRLLGLLAASVAATLSSMIPCTPILLVISPEITLAGIVANVFAGPIGELVALPSCLAHALLSPLPAVERGAALVGSGALLVVRSVAHASADARFLAVPFPPPTAWQLAALAVVGGALLIASTRARRLAWLGGLVAVTLALELAAFRAGNPRGELRVTAIDVEQGDSTLIDFPDGTLMLVDAGGYVGSPVDPGRSVIVPLLRARRRSRLDIVVLSHPHPDHFGGLPSVLDAVPVGEVWDTGQGASEGAGPVYKAWLGDLRARGIPIRGPRELCGSRPLGGATIDVLGPCPSFVPRRDANDNSFVFRLRYGERAVLMTGDAEAEQEHELVARQPELLSADLLKVGHHGSRTSSSPAFLGAVRPSLATISCGVRNRYGHPHAEALASLRAAGVRVARLDRTGGVIWQTDGQSLRVSAYSPPR